MASQLINTLGIKSGLFRNLFHRFRPARIGLHYSEQLSAAGDLFIRGKLFDEPAAKIVTSQFCGRVGRLFQIGVEKLRGLGAGQLVAALPVKLP